MTVTWYELLLHDKNALLLLGGVAICAVAAYLVATSGKEKP
jgi:hypothetical protein